MDAQNNPAQRPSRLLGRRFVKKRFQLRFSLVIFALFIGMTVLNWVIGRQVINHMLEMGLVSSTEFAAQLRFLNDVIVKSSMLGAVFIYGVCVFYSHAIAGPIYRFEQVLKGMEKGDYDASIRLRRFDEFRDVADALNRVLASLRAHRDKSKKTSD